MVSNKALDALHAANAHYRTEIEQIDSLAADGVFDEEEVRPVLIYICICMYTHTHTSGARKCKRIAANRLLSVCRLKPSARRQRPNLNRCETMKCQ